VDLPSLAFVIGVSGNLGRIGKGPVETKNFGFALSFCQVRSINSSTLIGRKIKRVLCSVYVP